MLEHDFDQEIDRRNTGSLKWEKYAGTEVLPMWVADMDFASPPAVVDALQKRVAHSVFGYSRPHASLVAETIAYLKRVHGVVDRLAAWLCAGAQHGLRGHWRAGCKCDDELTGLSAVPACAPRFRPTADQCATRL
jgi:aspartate/methionine/tyrosine aminotransferase